MAFVKYDILYSYAASFDLAVDEMLARIDARYTLLRVVVFAGTFTNEQYAVERYRLIGLFEERFGDRAPLVSYVAQHPLAATYIMEVQMVDKGVELEYKMEGEHRYITATSSGARMLFTAGIVPIDLGAPIGVQSHEVFEVISRILEREGYGVQDIVRQWNFIERITHVGQSGQHYQLFNDARTEFYAHVDWSAGYPAATGIGTTHGGVMVEIDAGQALGEAKIVALDNSLQVAAHEYSEQVLLGSERLSTPKFERAKAVDYGGGEVQIYISGTAAIRGEQSLTGVDVAGQTVSTLENIEYLVGCENMKKHGIFVDSEPQIRLFRVYLKFRSDFLKAKDVISKRYPTVPTLYVITDVCRDELLIEIEGVAEF